MEKLQELFIIHMNVFSGSFFIFLFYKAAGPD